MKKKNVISRNLCSAQIDKTIH